jgi:penicillin G amidase
MKWLRALVSLALAATAFWALDNRHGTFPALGKLLDPFSGFWRNGDRSDDLPGTLAVPGLREEVRIVWDDRRVPHIFAANDHDLYLAQGYVAATLRLWQMDFQSLYTAGRISEVIGPLGVRQDLFTRRFGLPWAAERTVEAFREDAATRAIIEAFTAGVNARINDLGRKGLPVEFKVLDYRPEPWTDLKCALLLKAMSFVLATYNQDAALTGLRDALGEGTVEALFPYVPPLVDPVIPPETPLDFTPVPVPGTVGPSAGASVSSAPARGPDTEALLEPDAAAGPGPAEDSSPMDSRTRPGIGSNNWAVAGRLAANGHPILCNDMHLELALPAIWYELQLAAPGVNVRGVAFPAAPFVIAGYNEDVAWGFTNGTDDVLDWYAITFKDGSRAEYLYGGEWRKTSVREERIKVRGAKTVVDRIVHTHYGPIVLWPGETPFPNMNVPAGAALRWAGHDPSREFRALGLLNRARGYEDYLAALREWDCPAQNIVFADRSGTIALWHNGKFPLRAKGQGRFVLDGADPANAWRGWVPHEHVPHVKDPERGFVSSANQLAVDKGYPYYLGSDYGPFERGARINELLRRARDITPEDMVRMQADVVDVRARAVVPRLIEVLEGAAASGTEKRCLEELRRWDFEARAARIAPTVFRELWNELNRLTWDDERTGRMERMPRPASQITVDLILDDPGSPYFDDKTTGGGAIESLVDIARLAFRSAVAKLEARLGPIGESWTWGRAKATQLRHLARVPGFGRDKVETDGAGQVINAIDAVWAPSWRMVVELGPEVRAWGNYPGGQSGNPGSKSYDDRVDDWAAGKPYELLFLKSPDEASPRIVRRTVMRGAR